MTERKWRRIAVWIDFDAPVNKSDVLKGIHEHIPDIEKQCNTKIWVVTATPDVMSKEYEDWLGRVPQSSASTPNES